jgi:hypothetical protein
MKAMASRSLAAVNASLDAPVTETGRVISSDGRLRCGTEARGEVPKVAGTISNMVLLPDTVELL